MIWRLFKKNRVIEPFNAISDKKSVSEIAKSWCYYHQYAADPKKSLSEKIEYFRDIHNPKKRQRIDTLIYKGISLGAFWDDGENNNVQDCLNSNFLKDANS